MQYDHSYLSNVASDQSHSALPEPDTEVSSVVAMQINEQYREVLSRKQGEF